MGVELGDDGFGDGLADLVLVGLVVADRLGGLAVERGRQFGQPAGGAAEVEHLVQPCPQPAPEVAVVALPVGAGGAGERVEHHGHVRERQLARLVTAAGPLGQCVPGQRAGRHRAGELLRFRADGVCPLLGRVA
ncbi:hypothetical protein [Pseudonocardia nigra]|uniref:hypothetical protein n=1 Tax=Pseudonocardia nigra TaxID=1921578 RepID=UPI001C601D07|nr:hypothetical protein [Pseudonocardia nigra]